MENKVKTYARLQHCLFFQALLLSIEIQESTKKDYCTILSKSTKGNDFRLVVTHDT